MEGRRDGAVNTPTHLAPLARLLAGDARRRGRSRTASLSCVRAVGRALSRHGADAVRVFLTERLRMGADDAERLARRAVAHAAANELTLSIPGSGLSIDW